MTTPRKITLEEAKDIAYEIANRDDASDDLRALCQFVGLLDADPIEALEAERAAHQVTAHRLDAAFRRATKAITGRDYDSVVAEHRTGER